MKKILQSQKGMSLVEVMIAGALSVGISMGIVQMNKTSQQGMSKISSDMELRLFQTNVLSRYLGKSEICEANIAGIDVTSSTAAARSITTLYSDLLKTQAIANKDPVGSSKGTTPKLPLWKITDMTLQEFVAYDAASSPLLGTCTLSVEYYRTNKQSGGSKSIIQQLPINCRVDSSGLIQACSSASAGVSNIWSLQQKASYDYLHYDAPGKTKVSIGSLSTGKDMNSALQINETGDTWPVDNLVSTYKSAIGIPDTQEGALSFDNFALVKSASNCFNLFHDAGASTATPPINYMQYCNNDATNGYASIIIGSEGSVNTGSSSTVVSGMYNNITGENSFAAGLYNNVAGSNSYAFGRLNNVSSFHSNTMLLGYSYASAYPQYSTKSNHFSGRFTGGYKFSTWGGGKPGGANVINDAGVFISPGALVGIGDDIESMSALSFPSGTKPKLHVDGEVNIVGDLYVGGQSVLKAMCDIMQASDGTAYTWVPASGLAGGGGGLKGGLKYTPPKCVAPLGK